MHKFLFVNRKSQKLSNSNHAKMQNICSEISFSLPDDDDYIVDDDESIVD